MEPLYQPQGIEERWQRTWEEEGLYNAEAGTVRETFVDRPSAAERDRARCTRGTRCRSRSRTRSCAGIGCAGSRRRSDRVRPRGDRAQTAVRGTWPHRARRCRTYGREAFVELVLGVAPRVRRHDHGPVPTHRRLDGLPARAVHDGRRVLARGDALLRALTEKGWIYRANRIINWCPGCHETSLSDLELEHEEVDDALT